MSHQSSRRARLHDLFESDPRRANSFAELVVQYGHRFPGDTSGHGTLTAPLGALDRGAIRASSPGKHSAPQLAPRGGN